MIFEHVEQHLNPVSGSCLIANFVLTKIGPRSYHLLERLTKVTTGSFPFSSLRIGREQHVLDSSNHRLATLPFRALRGNRTVMVSPVVHPRLFRTSHHLTFRALHGSPIVSTPFQTIVEEDTRNIVTHVSVHTLTFHETHYPLSPPGTPNKIQYLIRGGRPTSNC